jgi:hypothetical protein
VSWSLLVLLVAASEQVVALVAEEREEELPGRVSPAMMVLDVEMCGEMVFAGQVGEHPVVLGLEKGLWGRQKRVESALGPPMDGQMALAKQVHEERWEWPARVPRLFEAVVTAAQAGVAVAVVVREVRSFEEMRPWAKAVVGADDSDHGKLARQNIP